MSVDKQSVVQQVRATGKMTAGHVATLGHQMRMVEIQTDLDVRNAGVDSRRRRTLQKFFKI
jgi:hypothetical protein